MHPILPKKALLVAYKLHLLSLLLENLSFTQMNVMKFLGGNYPCFPAQTTTYGHAYCHVLKLNLYSSSSSLFCTYVCVCMHVCVCNI